MHLRRARHSSRRVADLFRAVSQSRPTAEKWWNDCAEYEATHEIAFASPRALLEARMIAEMDKARRPHRRAHRNGVAR